jgi:hypothetical protein
MVDGRYDWWIYRPILWPLRYDEVLLPFVGVEHY